MMQINNKGFSLLEVLVAIGLLSLFLASILCFQVKQLNTHHYIYQRSVAATRLFSLIERLRVVPDSKRSLVFRVWEKETVRVLPFSHASYACRPTCGAQIQWGPDSQYALEIGGYSAR